MGQDGKRKSTKVSKVEKADIRMSKAAASVDDNSVAHEVGKLGELADQPPMRALCAAVIAAGVLSGNVRLRRAGLAMLLAHQIATNVKTIMKHAIDRTRPSVTAERGEYRLGKGRHDHHDYNSFPSGHTAGAVAAARAFSRVYPERGAAAHAAAAFAAAVQVPRGKHFPTDVAAGIAIGLAAEAVAHRLTDI